MMDGSIEQSLTVQISDDALGLGRAVEGLTREIRKGPEGLLDRADRFYQLKQIVFPVRSAKQEAKAITIRAEALREAAAILGATSAEGLAATRMMIADYSRRYQNIEATISRSLPMIDPEAKPDNVDDDWLGFAFDYIGGVSDAMVQELWARLLAQEANHAGSISKRAMTKLALMDRRSTYTLRKILQNVVTLYIPTPDRGPGHGKPLYKIGRFTFPLLIEMLDWSGPRPGDDLVRGLDHGHDGPAHEHRRKVRWLIEEGFVREVPPDRLRDGYLNQRFWDTSWGGRQPLGIRIGLGEIFECYARDFNELVRRYANGGATTQVLQLTDLSEALLDPRITRPEVISDSPVKGDDLGHEQKTVELFLIEELKLKAHPVYEGIAENPGFLGRDPEVDQNGLQFYYF